MQFQHLQRLIDEIPQIKIVFLGIVDLIAAVYFDMGKDTLKKLAN